MSWLSRKKVPLDPRLEQLWLRPEDHDNLDGMQEVISRIEYELLDLAYENGETPVVLAVSWPVFPGGYPVFLLTDQHAYELDKRGKVKKTLPVADIAETGLSQGRHGMIVRIITRTGLDDYMPNTIEQMQHVSLMQYPTPRVARQVCALVDQVSPLI